MNNCKVDQSRIPCKSQLTLVIPTVCEVNTIRDVILGAIKALDRCRIHYHIVIVDDGSDDGTPEIVEALLHHHKALRLLRRTGGRGLSGAALDGWQLAEAEVLALMDGDLQHPPDALEAMWLAISNGADLVVASRFISGASIERREACRIHFSRLCIGFIRPLLIAEHRVISDPLSGMFMIREERLRRARIRPRGFKILLELIVCSSFSHVVEIPIRFSERKHGTSKNGFLVVVESIRSLLSRTPVK